jgi:hypothetical protein
MRCFFIFGERKAHPSLGVRERHTHEVEVVIRERYGNREPLGVG